MPVVRVNLAMVRLVMMGKGPTFISLEEVNSDVLPVITMTLVIIVWFWNYR